MSAAIDVTSVVVVKMDVVVVIDFDVAVAVEGVVAIDVLVSDVALLVVMAVGIIAVGVDSGEIPGEVRFRDVAFKSRFGVERMVLVPVLVVAEVSVISFIACCGTD